MKKLLCVLLSVIFVLSSCAVFTASAEEGDESDFGFSLDDLGNLSDYMGGYDLEAFDVPNFYDVDFDALIASGMLDAIDVGGMTLDQIYNSVEPIPWKDMTIDSSTLYLAMGNINLYFRNFFKKYYTAELMYSSRNASWLANRLCDIFFGPDHPDIAITLDNDEVGQQLPFIRATLRGTKSGISTLVQLIQANWIDSGLNYLPIVYALGVDLDDIWDKNDAQEVLEEIFIALINNFLDDPLYTVMDVIWAVCRTYDGYMNKPIKAAFATRVANSDITLVDLEQPHNVLNLMFNSNNKNDTEHLQFLTVPYCRIGRAADRVEVFYYLVVYAMLIGSYGNNEAIFDSYENSVQTYDYVAVSQTDKDYICSLIDGFTGGDLAGVISFTTGTFQENIKEDVDNIFQKILDRIKEIFVNFVTMLDNFFGFKDRWT